MTIADRIEVAIPRTVIGVGATSELGSLAKSFSPRRVLILTDPGVVKAGLMDTVRAGLASEELDVEVFEGCGAEAPVSVIEVLVQKVRDESFDLLIGVGGGSVMDTTKVVSIVTGNSGATVQDFLAAKLLPKALPKILIPTTAGTGSEWSTSAVVTTDTTSDRTLSFRSPLNRPDAVIIDPALSRGLPAATTAHTGVDALSHAIESYTSCRANFLSDLFAAKAMELVSASLGPVYAKGQVRMEDRYNMAAGASLAMLAASMAGVGLAHFMNHALGKRARVPHGVAVGLMLPYVMEYNMVASPGKYAEVARLLGENTAGLCTREAAPKSVEAVRALLSELNMPQRLSEVGVTQADIPGLVEELIGNTTPAIVLYNPRECGAAEATMIFTRAL